MNSVVSNQSTQVLLEWDGSSESANCGARVAAGLDMRLGTCERAQGFELSPDKENIAELNQVL